MNVTIEDMLDLAKPESEIFPFTDRMARSLQTLYRRYSYH